MRDNGLTVAADAMWGAPCLAYNIQCVLPDDVLDAIAQLQRELLGAGLPIFNLCPRGSLHTSIYALVPARSPIAGKEDYWAGVSAKALSDLDRLCRDRRSIALHFNEIRLTPAAIIAVARAAPDLIDDIRMHFSKWPAQPGWVRPRYDIAHVTWRDFRWRRRYRPRWFVISRRDRFRLRRRSHAFSLFGKKSIRRWKSM